MYVPGQLVDTNKVLLDIGTGYYAERTRSDADDFCKRKADLLEQQIKKLQPVLESRYESMETVQKQMQNLMLAQKQGAAAAAK